jgi:hypothetical protein
MIGREQDCKAFTWHWSTELESQYSQDPGLDSNRVRPKLKSTALLLNGVECIATCTQGFLKMPRVLIDLLSWAEVYLLAYLRS